MDMFSPPATPKSSTLASAVPRSKSFGDLSQLTSGNSSISSRSSTSFSPVPASPRPPKPNLSLTLPIPSTLSTADTVVFKNDQIFKIKSHEAYLAPAHLTSHLSFRKGQAFYALNHNDQTKCFFVSTEYATPFSRTAVNGFVPDRYFDVVELNTGKNKGKGKENPAAVKPAPTTTTTTTASNAHSDPSRRLSNASIGNSMYAHSHGSQMGSRTSLNSMALLAALQKEQEQLMRQAGRTSASSTSNTSNTLTTSTTQTPNTTTPTRSMSQQQQMRSRMNEAGAELERELRNTLSQTDLNAKQPLSRRASLLRSVSKSALSKFMMGGATPANDNTHASGAPPAEEAPPMPLLNDTHQQRPLSTAFNGSLQRPSPALPSSSSETPTAASHNSSVGSGGVRAASFFRMISNLLPGSNHSPDGLINTKKRSQQQQQQQATSTNNSTTASSSSSSYQQPTANRPRATSTSAATNPSKSPFPKSPSSSFYNAPKTPKTPRTAFFRFGQSARTPNAPTAQPSAVPYLAMRSPSLGGYNSSGPNTPTQGTFTDTHSNNNNNSNAAAVATSTGGGGGGVGGAPIPSVYQSSHQQFLPSDADLAAYPIPLGPRSSTGTSSIQQGQQQFLERMSDHSERVSVASGASGLQSNASVGTTSGGTSRLIKSSLKKSSSSFWG